MILSNELTVLSRAIPYKNLSSAAENIGISQPQLSRIIKKLETELNISLLDRSSKRKSSWTSHAHELADLIHKNHNSFNKEVLFLKNDQCPKHVSIGILEGLIPFGVAFCEKLFKEFSEMDVELNVLDLNKLDESFLKGDLDLLITSHSPNKRKYEYSKIIGYQHLSHEESKKGIPVLSSYELAIEKSKPNFQQYLVSNSLHVRKLWIEKYKGRGTYPSPLKDRKQTDSDFPIFLLGNDNIGTSLWKSLLKLT